MRSSSHHPESAAAAHSIGERSPAGAAVDAALAGMSADFQHFIADLEELVQATTTLTGEDLVHAKDRLNARVASAREAFDHISSGVAARSRSTLKAADAYVRKEPWTIIAISAATGLLFGFLLGRRGGDEP
jgi:ElaB/YqjD/DUF883 family membrane-anchored ribosome-binding protein